MTISRATAAIMRRVRLKYLQLRYPRARFGARCDIGAGFHLTLEDGGDLRVGSRCVLDRSMTIECRGVLHIGERVIFGHHCTLASRQSLIIGDDCLLAEMVSVRDHDHRFDRLDVPIREQGAVSADVVIGKNVWVGAKATIVKGVTIGDNAIIGANAVVTRDIPANAIAVGIPAHVLRLREDSNASPTI